MIRWFSKDWTRITLKIFQDVFSKEYESEDAAAKLPYFPRPGV